MSGSHECRLVGGIGGHLSHHSATEDHHGAVAGELHLLKLRRVQQDCGTTGREIAEQVVDLALGADVDTARGVEAQQRPHIVGHPACDGHLLLVAAGQATHLALGARVDLQPLDGALDAALLVTHVDETPAAWPGPHGRAMFSRTERCSRRPSARLPGT